MARARQDQARLRELDPKLAAELERTITGAADGSRGGIASQYE